MERSWWRDLLKLGPNLRERCSILCDMTGLHISEVEKGIFRSGRPKLEGEIDGHPLVIKFLSNQGDGTQSDLFTTCDVRVQNPYDKKFSIRQEQILDSLGKLIGIKDVQTGDKWFDHKFFLRSSDELFLQSLLTPEMRQLIRQIWVSPLPKARLELRENRLRYREQFHIKKPERMAMAIKMQVALATALRDGKFSSFEGKPETEGEVNQEDMNEENYF